MSAPTADTRRSRFAIEVQPFAGAPWRDDGLRVDAHDHTAAEAIARREYPNAAGVWASLLREPYIHGFGHRLIVA